MPTSRPRHTITETPPVKQALDELRVKLPHGAKVDYAELLTLGAEVKAHQVGSKEEAARRARQTLAEMIRTRSIPVDVEAAEEVHRFGWVPKDG